VPETAKEDVLALCNATTRHRHRHLVGRIRWRARRGKTITTLWRWPPWPRRSVPSNLSILAANDNNEQGEDDPTDVEADFTFKARATIVDQFQSLWGLNVSQVKQRHTFESGCRFLWEAPFWRTHAAVRAPLSDGGRGRALRVDLDSAAGLAGNVPTC
jgi:hypothetical protein